MSGVSLSDFNSGGSKSSKRRKRQPIVNLAKEYKVDPVQEKVFIAPVEDQKKAVKKAQDTKLNATVKQLEKNIVKTDKALVQLKFKLGDTLEIGKYHSSVSLASNVSFQCNPTKLDFLDGRGNPKSVLNYIIINLDSTGMFSSTTEDFINGVQIKNEALKKSLGRLEARGFIKIHSVRGVSHRRILVNPSIYSF
jgi:co-chaperonin GroES (HSP10)